MACGLRRIFALLLFAGILPGVLVRDGPRARSVSQQLVMIPLELPPKSLLTEELGPFELAGAWRMESPNSGFSSYSGLIALGGMPGAG